MSENPFNIGDRVRLEFGDEYEDAEFAIGVVTGYYDVISRQKFVGYKTDVCLVKFPDGPEITYGYSVLKRVLNGVEHMLEILD